MHLREVVDPEEPGLIRALSSIAARAQLLATPGKRRLMKDELRRSFTGRPWTDRGLEKVARSAYDLQVQCLVEELVLGRLTGETIGRFMRFDGRERLDAALDRGKGVVLVFPHAGNVMLLIALLSLSGYAFTQVAARGFPPPERQLSADVRPSWLNRRAREARERDEDRLPARFHGMDAPPRQLYRDLADNRIVGIAFDGRGGSRFSPVPYLGRTALLSTGPWRLAATTGATVLPAFCVRDRDRTHRLHLCDPIVPDATTSTASAAQTLVEQAIAAIEPLLQRHPDHYARWLAHCRQHAAMDDHPLFADTAPESRWRAGGSA